MKKNIISTILIILFLSLTVNSFPSRARETLNIQHEVIKYDLSQADKQTFTIISDSGEISYVTIEPLDSKLRINDGTYKVTYTVPNSWVASFQVKISNNLISSVSNPAVSATTGIVYSYALNKNSSTKATLNINWRNNQGMLYATGFYAWISNGNLYSKKL